MPMATAKSSLELTSIPTLDEVVKDSRRIGGLNQLALAALALKCASVQAAISAELMRSAETGAVERDTPKSSRLLTGQQIAEHLEIKESWVMSEARANRIPKKMVGRYVRFDLGEVQRALEQRQA
jgi:predicted DNA-binding transcriptional regulator AlpA